MTIGESISELYRSRTEADFEHMRSKVEAMNASLEPGQFIPESEFKGYSLACLLLSLRAMEAAENDPRFQVEPEQRSLFA